MDTQTHTKTLLKSTASAANKEIIKMGKIFPLTI